MQQQRLTKQVVIRAIRPISMQTSLFLQILSMMAAYATKPHAAQVCDITHLLKTDNADAAFAVLAHHQPLPRVEQVEELPAVDLEAGRVERQAAVLLESQARKDIGRRAERQRLHRVGLA